MSAKVLSAAVLGLNCELVEVEADTSASNPGIFIVGLPDKAVDESRERVRSAIKNSDLSMPRGKVTINLAPADLKKEGPAYDLPIAISILLASKQLFLTVPFDQQIFIGELALDGQLRPVNGVLSICLEAKNKGIKTVYLPQANAAEGRGTRSRRPFSSGRTRRWSCWPGSGRNCAGSGQKHEATHVRRCSSSCARRRSSPRSCTSGWPTMSRRPGFRPPGSRASGTRKNAPTRSASTPRSSTRRTRARRRTPNRSGCV